MNSNLGCLSQGERRRKKLTSKLSTNATNILPPICINTAICNDLPRSWLNDSKYIDALTICSLRRAKRGALWVSLKVDVVVCSHFFFRFAFASPSLRFASLRSPKSTQRHKSVKGSTKLSCFVSNVLNICHVADRLARERRPRKHCHNDNPV